MTLFDALSIALTASGTLGTVYVCIRAYRLERENDALKECLARYLSGSD